MTRLIGLLVVLCLLFSVPVQAELSQSMAQRLFIPIMCDGLPDGTGFPVAPHLLMTAGHVRCDEGQATTISLDNGKTWLKEEDWFVNGDADVAILVVNDVKFKTIAEIREPKLGEAISGYGIPYGGLLSTGIVAHLDPDSVFVFVTNIPIGGMSGSAIVGADGKVVGMVNFGMPDQRVGGTLSGGYRGDFLKVLLEGFKKFLAAKAE